VARSRARGVTDVLTRERTFESLIIRGQLETGKIAPAAFVNRKSGVQSSQPAPGPRGECPGRHVCGCLIPTAAAIGSLRHPEVRAKRASKDGNRQELVTHPSRPAQERGHLRMTVTVGAVGIIVAKRKSMCEDVTSPIRSASLLEQEHQPGQICASGSLTRQTGNALTAAPRVRYAPGGEAGTATFDRRSTQ
jgi:hypothetical protein